MTPPRNFCKSVVLLLEGEGELSATQIRDKLSAHYTSITRSLSFLEEQKLVQRKGNLYFLNELGSALSKILEVTGEMETPDEEAIRISGVKDRELAERAIKKGGEIELLTIKENFIKRRIIKDVEKSEIINDEYRNRDTDIALFFVNSVKGSLGFFRPIGILAQPDLSFEQKMGALDEYYKEYRPILDTIRLILGISPLIVVGAIIVIDMVR